MDAWAKKNLIFHPNLAQQMSAVLTGLDAPETSRRAAAVAALAGHGARTSHSISIPAFLHSTLEPLPCRLSTADLVELLKYPTCVGSARRVILNQFEQGYRQKFADQWAFVRFAEKQTIGLDFMTPPVRLDFASSAGMK